MTNISNNYGFIRKFVRTKFILNLIFFGLSYIIFYRTMDSDEDISAFVKKMAKIKKMLTWGYSPTQLNLTQPGSNFSEHFFFYLY